LDYSLNYSRRAIQESREAYLFYKDHSPKVAQEFKEALKIHRELLLQNPHAFQVSRAPYRELYLGKFPYLIIYSIHSTTISIHSIFHTSKSPSKKPN
jgi:plasmid stabilization system protein ParE